jgi:L-fuconolactonase
MPYIDAHLHLWDPARGDYGWLTPQQPLLYRRFAHTDAKPLLDASRIDGAVLIQAAPSSSETDYLLQIADSVPWVLGVVGWVDLDAPDAPEVIARRSRHPKFVGIRPMLQDLREVDWIMGPQRAPALQAMQRHRLVFDALIRPAHLPLMEQLASQYSSLAIVIDHAAKPTIGPQVDQAWLSAMRRIAAYRNVSCKISGLLTELRPGAQTSMVSSYIATLIDLFEPHRLLWGSDWPVLTLAASYSEWASLAARTLEKSIPQGVAAIMGGTALRTYQLGTRA